jgi:M-phase inducer tyrosine phosphatase
MVPSTVLEHDEGSSFDGPDMSSPAQAYAKRQQVKAIRRRDGTEDFRPLTGATAMVQRDMFESPSAKFMAAGLPGFGDNETLGKILPCHRVREDGLMRVVPKTVIAFICDLGDNA